MVRKSKEADAAYMRDYRKRERAAVARAEAMLGLLKNNGTPIDPGVELNVLLKAAIQEFNSAPQHVQDMLVKEIEKALRRGFEAWEREGEKSE